MEVIVSESVRPHIIVLLTDGQPTVGVTSHSAILKNVRERNKEGAAIFCLGFGEGADMKLLERISLQVCRSTFVLSLFSAFIAIHLLNYIDIL